MFEALTQSTVSAGLIEGLPEYNQDYLSDVSTDELDIVGLGFTNSSNQIGLFQDAHAYDLSWSQVLGVVSMLIGLDSLQVIWEQVGNSLMGREVDGVALSVAILDVLSLFPPAAPLKTVTIPAKLAIKLLRVGNTKAVKYLGGVLKKMFQKAKGRDFSLVFQGIAFMIIIADMAKDEDGREAIKTLATIINSTDDFIDILDFFSLADDEIGSSVDDVAYLPSKFGLFPNAYAVVAAKSAATITKAISEAAPIIARTGGAAPKGMGAYAKLAREIGVSAGRSGATKAEKKFAKDLLDAAFRKDNFKGIMGTVKNGGIHSIRNVARCRFDGQRTSPFLMLGIIGYLEGELFVDGSGDANTPLDQNGNPLPSSDGRLFEGLSDEEYTRQIIELQTTIVQALPSFCRKGRKKGTSDKKQAKKDSVSIRQAHGKAFQLMQLAILNLAGEKIKGIEVERDVYLFQDGEDLEDELYSKALAYGRDVDILVEREGKEVWIEQKSWKGKGNTDELAFGVTPWTWGSGIKKQRKDADFGEFDLKQRGSAGHRQLTLDHISVGSGAIKRNTRPIDRDPLPITVSGFEWQFQKFKSRDKNKNIFAQSPDIKKLQKAYSKLPNKTDLFDEHTGFSRMQTKELKEGSLSALLGVFEGEFAELVKSELTENGIDLTL